jgi:hypothetical protein
MNPLLIIGLSVQDAQKEMGLVSIEPVYDSLEAGEQQEYSIESSCGKWEVSLDSSNIITTVFLYLCNGCDGILGLNYTMSRSDVLELLGTPISTGEPHLDPFLGEYGAWEKFSHNNIYIHVEHEHKENNIKQVTLMVN